MFKFLILHLSSNSQRSKHRELSVLRYKLFLQLKQWEKLRHE